VSWYTQGQQWTAQITHTGKEHSLGRFDDEQEAARAYDTAARLLRPDGEAHGGRSGKNWQRLNFPTAEEGAFAAQQGMPGIGAADDKSAVAAKAEAQGFKSDYLGVGWNKGSSRWRAQISHSRKNHNLGLFDDEQEAARAFDAAARRLRSQGEAHGGRSGTYWHRLNFPTAEEAAFAAQQGMPGTGAAEEMSAVVSKAEAQGF
jgi:hypothetical protein